MKEMKGSEDKLFEVTWMDASVKILPGKTPDEALTRAGYSASSNDIFDIRPYSFDLSDEE